MIMATIAGQTAGRRLRGQAPEQGFQGGSYPLRTPGRYQYLGPKPAGHPEARGDASGSYWFWRWDINPQTGLTRGET